MLIYTESVNDSNHIFEDELEALGEQLAMFVEVYSNNVVLSQPRKDRDILLTLNQISKAILNKEYSKLFNDPSIVIKTEDIPF